MKSKTLPISEKWWQAIRIFYLHKAEIKWITDLEFSNFSAPHKTSGKNLIKKLLSQQAVQAILFLEA